MESGKYAIMCIQDPDRRFTTPRFVGEKLDDAPATYDTYRDALKAKDTLKKNYYACWFAVVYVNIGADR